MKIKITYPELSRQNRWFYKMRNIMRYVIIFAAIACSITNLAVGGKPWAVVVLWSLCSFWNLFLNPNQIEFNFLSQIAKTLYYVCILLILIDVCLVRGWAHFVVPIVGFAGLILSSVFLLLDIHQQMKNSMPLIWIIAVSLAATIYSIISSPKVEWPMIVLGSVAGTILLLMLIFHKQFINELKKRFHTN